MTSPSTPILTLFVRREIDRDGTVWHSAEYVELPGCVVYSKDEDELASRLEAAKEAYLAHLAAHGLPIPERPDVTDDKPRFIVASAADARERVQQAQWEILTTGQWEAIPVTV